MKAKLLIFTLMILSCHLGISQATVRSEYLFTNGSLNNSGVNTNPLNQTGSALVPVTGIENVMDGAIQLNGDILSAPSNVSASSAFWEYSVSFWIKTTDVSATPKDIINHNGSGTQSSGWIFTLENGDLKAWMRFYDPGRQTWQQITPITYTHNNIADGQWHHVVLTIDTSTFFAGVGGNQAVTAYKLYVDTAQVLSQSMQRLAVGAPIPVPNEPLEIGANHTSSTSSYADQIDNIRYYHGLLNTADINNLYSEYISPNQLNRAYVDVNATGNNDGSSWADAFTDLQDGITAAGLSVTKEVWVAQGTYKPTTTNSNARFATYTIPFSDVKLYGGFDGTEVNLSDRDITAHPVIISGDLNGDDTSNINYSESSRSDNAYRLFIVQGNNITIDGVTIKDGHGDRNVTNSSTYRGSAIYVDPSVTSFNLKNSVIENNVTNRGGAINVRFLTGSSQLTIENCIFRRNFSAYASGIQVLSDQTVQVDLLGNLFHNNISSDIPGRQGLGGSTIACFANSGNINLTAVNNTFTQNLDQGTGSGTDHATLVIRELNSSSTMTASFYNNIFYENYRSNPGTPNPNEIGRMNVSNSLTSIDFSYNNTLQTNIGSLTSNYTSGNNLAADPLFIDVLAEDFQLQSTSPMINAGDNASVPASLTTDLAGNNRVGSSVVDMGAYEFTTPNAGNDLLADAIAVTLGATCSGTPYATQAASLETNEPVPVALNNLTLTESVWFEFVAPPSGNALVTLSNTATPDLALAAYPAPTTAGDVSTLGTELDARFGFSSTSLTDQPAFLDLSNLVAGDTYVVQVLGNSAAALSSFCLAVEETTVYEYNNGWVSPLGSPATNTDPLARIEVNAGTAQLNLNNATSPLLFGHIQVSTGATLEMINNSHILHYGSITSDGNILSDETSTISSAITGEGLQGTGSITTGNLEIYNRFAGATVDVPVLITNTLSIQEDVDINNGLTFVSTPALTAVFDSARDLGSGAFKSLTGDVTVERSIPVTAGNTGRAYRFMGTAVQSSGTIFDNWQEAGNAPAGYGTFITGSAGAFGMIDPSTGLDQTQTGEYSMFAWSNDTSQNWNTITTTNQPGDVLDPGDAYLIWIRGDRNIDMSLINHQSNNTVIRSTGTLLTSTLTSTYDVDGGNYVMVSNPYQNALDIEAFIDRSTNIEDNLVYFWDPTLGGSAGYGAYVTYIGFVNGGSGFGIPSTNNTDYLQPGQAFFVIASSGANGVNNDLVAEFDPADTDASQVLTGMSNRVFSVESNAEILIQLYDKAALENGLGMNDATLIRFCQGDDMVSGFKKLMNPAESLAIPAGNDYLAIANVDYPQQSREIPLSVLNLQQTDYIFRIKVEEMGSNKVYLEDKLFDEHHVLENGWNTIHFSSDKSNGANIEDRFAVVVGEKSNAIDTAFAKAITLFPNPIEDGRLSVRLPSSEEEATITVKNLMGQQVYEQQIANNSAIGNEIDLTELAAGVYMFHIKTQNHDHVEKIIVR